MFKTMLLFIAVSMMFPCFTRGQTIILQLVGTSGESIKNATYQLDFSIGEMLIETHENSQYMVTQGFHQGTYIVSAIEENPALSYQIKVYPNPVNDFIHLEIGTPITESIIFIVTDQNGKITHRARSNELLSLIDFSGYSNGIYFLTVMQKNHLLKSFKIIKN
jgi:hypothetical protein